MFETPLTYQMHDHMMVEATASQTPIPPPPKESKFEATSWMYMREDGYILTVWQFLDSKSFRLSDALWLCKCAIEIE